MASDEARITMSRRAPLGALAAFAALTLAAPALAQETGDVAAGRHMAEIWCSSCHRVDRQETQTDTGPPSFLAIARAPSTTAMALTVFLQTPHARMPNYVLSRKETQDVIAYILSLAGK